MNIDRTVRPEGADMPQELDGLQFTAETKLQHIPEREGVRGRECDGLQRRVVQAGIGRCEAAYREAEHGGRSIRHSSRVAGANHSRRQSRAVAHGAAESNMPVREDGALQSESG